MIVAPELLVLRAGTEGSNIQLVARRVVPLQVEGRLQCPAAQFGSIGVRELVPSDLGQSQV